jgi:hypothetical protein
VHRPDPNNGLANDAWGFMERFGLLPICFGGAGSVMRQVVDRVINGAGNELLSGIIRREAVRIVFAMVGMHRCRLLENKSSCSPRKTNNERCLLLNNSEMREHGALPLALCKCLHRRESPEFESQSGHSSQHLSNDRRAKWKA